MKKNPGLKQFVAVALLCVLFIIGMRGSGWQSDIVFHSILETGGTLIALFVALLALIRYYARRDLKILMLASAFFGVTVINIFHLLATSDYFSNILIGSHWQSLVPWSWMGERLFLGLYLVAAGDTLWTLGHSKRELNHQEPRAVLASTILVIASLFFFILLPHPDPYLKDALFGRPQEVFPALFFLLVFLSFLRLNYWHTDNMDAWLMQSMVLAFMGQACMSLAQDNFDAYYDAAHVLKLLGYSVLLYGLSRGIYELYAQEEYTRGQLSKNEKLLAEAQEMAHMGNWEWNLDSNDLFWSRELYRLFDVSSDHFKLDYENYLRVIHEDDRDMVNDHVQRCFSTGEPYEMVHRVGQGNDVRWLQCRGKAIFDDDNNMVRLVGTAQDITESYLNEERFRNLLEAAPDGMVICDEEGRIVLINAQTEALFGYRREELLGVAVETLMPERFREEHAGHRSDYFKDPVVRNMGAGLDLRGVHKDGSEFPIEVSLSPMKTSSGRMVIAAVRDVTESHAAQQALTRYARELERSNNELERFAYVASHDMKEPLRKIMAFGDRLAGRYRDKLDDAAHDYIQRMQDASQRMSMLIEDMLNYSRIEQRSGAWEDVDLQKLLESTLHNLDMVIQDNRATVNADPLPGIEGHPWQLEMLLQNLIGNALKYRDSERAPVIRIKVEEDKPQNGWVQISFEDNGIGFESQYGEKIFQPFERLHTHKDYPGTGVGLSICRKIVEHHHGHISATGEAGVGAKFVVQLPCRQDVAIKG